MNVYSPLGSRPPENQKLNQSTNILISLNETVTFILIESINHLPEDGSRVKREIETERGLFVFNIALRGKKPINIQVGRLVTTKLNMGDAS